MAHYFPHINEANRLREQNPERTFDTLILRLFILTMLKVRLVFRVLKNYVYEMVNYAKSAYTFDTVFFSGVWSFRPLFAYLMLQIFNILQEFIFFPYHFVKSSIELCSFVFFLGFPAYIKSRYYYKMDDYICKDIQYGENPCQLLDIYTCHPHSKGPLSRFQKTNFEDIGPTTDSKTIAGMDDQISIDSNQSNSYLRPVIVFIQGGGWTVCRKELYPVMGHIFRKHGIICVFPNYTSFPKAGVDVMIQEIREALSWIHEHIVSYGGSPGKIYLIGQSAGAQLLSVALLMELEEYLSDPATRYNLKEFATNTKRSYSSPSFLVTRQSTEWKWRGIKHLISIAGPYDIPALYENLVKSGKKDFCGLPDIFKGERNFEKYSPIHMVREIVKMNTTNLPLLFPPCTLIHATRDKTCLYQKAVEFFEYLKLLGVQCKFISYEGQSHLESIMEVLEGHENAQLVLDITKVILGNEVRRSMKLNHSWSWRMRSLLMRTLCPV